MRSSSTAQLVGAAAIVALVLSYSPKYLTPDVLAQSVALPLPALGFSLSGTFSATVVATSTTAKIASAQATNVVPTAASSQKTTYPRLVVPSLDLDDPIVPVGITSSGAMAVPSGKTDQVGWYDGGPQPGGVGSAVLDAHVFAAFSKLNQLQVGESIYVEMSPTQTLQFLVTKTQLFALSQITPQDLFISTNDRDLNLITCAGKLIDNDTTYDHRFVVYTTLVN